MRTKDELEFGAKVEDKWRHPLDTPLQDRQPRGLSQPEATLRSAYWRAPGCPASLSASMIDKRLRDLMQDEVALLASRALLLQQRVDGIVDSPSSYTAVNTRTGYHHCQAKVEGMARWSHEPLRVCNRLCYLSEGARSQLQYLDFQLQATLSRK